MRASFAIQLHHALEADPLQIEDDLRHVLTDVRDRRELMPDIIDSDARDGRAFQRPQQDSAQSIAKGRPIPGLHWLSLVAAVIQAGFNGLNVKLWSLQQNALPPCSK